MAPAGSRWDGWYPPSRPLPVEDGLRARSRRGPIGETWWSRRFLDLLESFGIGGRLDRGRTYARKGQVVSMDVEPGRVSAVVQGSRPRPYRVAIALDRLHEADWRRAEEALVSRAAFLATLLAGEMPRDIEEAFAACQLLLLPGAAADLTTRCSCPDPVNPCKHIAAVYYLLAEAFDDDPFLILRWRGRSRDELLANLRALRGSAPPTPEPEAEDPWTAIEEADPGDPADRVDRFWRSGAALAELRLDPTAPAVADAAVRRLGAFPVDADRSAVTGLLVDLYPAIATGARARLLGTDGPPDGEAPPR